MTIRNRLTLISSLTFGVVFALAALAVYYTFHVTSERIIFSELQKTGLLSAMFYLEEDELPVREHRRIRAEFESEMQQTDVKVYDAKDSLRFGNGLIDGKLRPGLLQRIRDQRRVNFKEEGYYYSGLFYPDNQGDFVIVVASSNLFFASQSNQLLLMMAIALIVGLGIIFLLSFWLSRVAYRPISSVIAQVNQLQADNLERALDLPAAKDEVRALVQTFNDLLARLSDNFVVQKNFVNYVSHEFKTPMAAIRGNIEVFGQKDRSPAEYKQVSGTLLRHIDELERILTNLMVLAGLRTAPASGQRYRVDELLWEVLDVIFAQHPDAKGRIRMDISVTEPDCLLAAGNSGQVHMAVHNLVDNAVKYANGKPIRIALQEGRGVLVLAIQDEGIGIGPADLERAHQPFYRGHNVGDTKGSGIGLSLAVLVCKQNNISFSIASEVGAGTTVTLRFSQL